jgi:hypothetical protein
VPEFRQKRCHMLLSDFSCSSITAIWAAVGFLNPAGEAVRVKNPPLRQSR